VCHRAFHDWFAERIPYAIVVVEILDDVRVVGACFSGLEQLECGRKVRADFSVSSGLDHRPVLSWTLTR
jgi:hypothetical protein